MGKKNVHRLKWLLVFGLGFVLFVVACSNADGTITSGAAIQQETKPTTLISALPTATAFPTKTDTPTPQPTSTPTSSPTPTDTATPTMQPTATSLPIESHTWDASPVLVQYNPKVCVDGCYGFVFSAFPKLILYSDGLMLIDGAGDSGLKAAQLSQNEVCAFLNTIDLFGFFEFDAFDYYERNNEFPRLQPSNYIETNAWKSNEVDAGGLIDFFEGNELEGEIQLESALVNTYRLLVEYGRKHLNSSAYVPDQIIVSVREVHPNQQDVTLFDAGVWPLEEIALRDIFERADIDSQRLILEDAEALTLFELFERDSSPALRIYSEDDVMYEVSIRVLLPYESMLSVGSAYGEKDIIPGSDVVYETHEITCSEQDGVVDEYYAIMEGN